MFAIYPFLLFIHLQVYLVISRASTKEHYQKSGIDTFWSEFEKALISVKPKDESISRITEQQPAYLRDFTTIPRPNFLNISKESFEQLKNSHSEIVKQIENLAPRLKYIPNTAGIVMTCDQSAYNYLLITIKMLRRAGSKLPIEVFVASQDQYSEKVCEELFPNLNAKCIVLTDITMNVHIFKYQYKVFAMLFSSFENMFFLDADDFAILNPDDLMTSPPYTEYGMVIWNDFWAETVSHIYYDIIDKETPKNLTTTSCEAGQLILSKKKHAKTLLLSVYYNLYGPGHYYRLFSQNNHGEGDKETFLMAAVFYNLPHYKLRTGVGQMNFYKHGNYDFLAMLQPHPTDDYNRHVKNNNNVKVRWLFIHANYPKLDIQSTIKYRTNDLAISNEGILRRIWAKKEVMEKEFGYDVEERVWQEVKVVTRELYPELISDVDRYYRVAIEESEMQPNDKQRLTMIGLVVFLVVTLALLVYKVFLKSRGVSKKD